MDEGGGKMPADCSGQVVPSQIAVPTVDMAPRPGFPSCLVSGYCPSTWGYHP